MLSNSVACLPPLPKVLYETKIVNPENKEPSHLARPFRDGGLLDEAEARVSTKGDSMFPESDLQERGIDRAGGRRERRKK